MPTLTDPRPLVSFSIILVLSLGSVSVSSAFQGYFAPQTNAVGLNLDGLRTAHFEPSSTPQVTTSFYGAFYSVYIIIHNENYPHCTILQIQDVPLATEPGISLTL